MAHYLILIALMVCSFVNVSCLNPFAPRLDFDLTAQSCADLTTIENLLCSFRHAYSFKDTTLYGSLIEDGFTFIYTDYDRGVDITWGREDEMRTTYGLFQSTQSLTLIWNNELSSSGNDTLRTSLRGFNLIVTFNPSDITRVDGYANLTFARANNQDPWKITRWRDESNF